MMAHFGRPREKFSDGVLPKQKPYTKEMFKKQSDLYLQGYFGAEDKELYKNNLENVFKKGVEEGVVSEKEALKWIQDRKKIYSTLIEEADKQPAELPPAYSVEPDINKYYENQLAAGGRAGFKYGGSWADWKTNFSDQMTFEEYLQMDLEEKKPHALDKADGGRVHLADGPPGTPKRKIYKTITPITDLSRIQAKNRGVIIPADAKWKMQLPGSAMRGSEATTQMVYAKTKGELNTALKDAEKIKYVKPKLPKNDPNSPLYEPPEVKKDKFFVKKETPKRITENINEVIYEEVIGSKNHPETYEKTGKVVKKYKPMIGGNKVTIPGEGVSTLNEAQTFVDDYFKKNPKKVIEKDPDAPKKSKDLKKQKIIAAKGEPLWLTGDSKVHKGHGTQVANPETIIKPSNIFATPEKINVAMAPKDTDAPKNIYTDLDFKIDAEETKMKNIKESNLPDSEKKIKLQAIDDKLTGYAIASKGYKTVTLSDGSTFNLGTQSTKSYDMMDIFPDMSEQDVKKFTRKYFTDTGKLKSEWTKGNIADVDKENIKKSYVFLENVKNAKANAEKILPKVEKEFKKFGLTLNSNQVNKAKTFLRSAMNKGQDIFKYMPNKIIRKGGGAAAAALDYTLFHHLFGVPATEAMISAGGWLKPLQNKTALQKIIQTTAMQAGEAEGNKQPQEEIIDKETIIKDRPFVWKQGVLESTTPVYGKYADQIKNLKIP